MEPAPPTPPPPSPDPVERARRPPARDGGRLGAALSLLAGLATAALFGVLLAGRELSAPPAAVNLLVLFLPYLFGAAAVVLFGLWAAIPDRRLPPLLLAACCVVGVTRWGPRWGPRAAPEGEPVSVLSWNVRRLWGDPAAEADATQCVIDAVKALDPDVVTFLEVSRADVDRLAAALDLECAHSPYFRGGGPKTGGLASCARRGRWHLRSGEGQGFVDAEDWQYVFAELERGDRVFNLLAVHLYPYRIRERDLRRSLDALWGGATDPVLDLQDQGERIVRAQGDQSAALLQRVARLHDPTVVAGDFNSTRDAALHVGLRGHLRDSWEQAGRGFGGTIHLFGQIPLRVDYVYASPQFAVSSAENPDFTCSDHLPVFTRLTLP